MKKIKLLLLLVILNSAKADLLLKCETTLSEQSPFFIQILETNENKIDLTLHENHVGRTTPIIENDFKFENLFLPLESKDPSQKIVSHTRYGRCGQTTFFSIPNLKLISPLSETVSLTLELNQNYWGFNQDKLKGTFSFKDSPLKENIPFTCSL